MTYFEYGSLITADDRLQRVIHTASNVASSKATVLVCGESGTGKELLAKFIHEKSPRANRRFIAINCAAVPEGLLESELFGYERGAFTGAVAQKIGKFELASESTLLLDEISEMPLQLQAKLLRVLQEEEVDRLGGRNPVKVNMRIIATTNRDLRAMVKAGQFREDLYYRLNVIPLQIPALRERPNDVVVLAEHFVKVSAILNSRQVSGLSHEAMQKIKTWSWPGNVRELENVMERAVLIADGAVIQPEHILIENQSAHVEVIQDGHALSLEAGVTIAEMERQLIMKTLDKTKQNRTQAAKLLGISIRTLRNKLHEYKASEAASG
jgi:transcriptional regulator with PAS, ATPase and Fis domain